MRQPFNFRISSDGLAWVRKISEEATVINKRFVSIADVMRACLAVGRRHEREIVEQLREWSQQ